LRLLLLAPAQGAAPPAQDQPPRACQAEFVICDQTIEELLPWLYLKGSPPVSSRRRWPRCSGPTRPGSRRRPCVGWPKPGRWQSALGHRVLRPG